MRRGVFLLGVVLVVVVFVGLPILNVGAGAYDSPLDVPGASRRMIDTYRRWDRACPGLRWELLAGVGWIESAHGTIGDARVGEDGRVAPPIFGPVLDGSRGTVALPIGAWLGRWGLAGNWQRALGPMQLLPGTFSAWGVDGEPDGILDPHDIDDAVATAAGYLCGATGEIVDEWAALLRYNRSRQYVKDVIRYADSLAAGELIVDEGWLCPVAGRVSFIDTWLAPRSGGRLHHGVDMFAVRGTPVVAPVAGEVEHYRDRLGGLSFRLWGADGNFYYGTHLARFGPRTGQVEAGTVIGFVGDTGNASGTGAHLHFEIHPGRRRGDPSGPVNPTPAVERACSALRVGAGTTAGE